MMMKEKLTERFNEIMSFDLQTPAEDVELKYICSHLEALEKIEKLEKPLKEVYERFKSWGQIAEDFASFHQKEGRPASENLSDIQGHFLAELWKAIKQALDVKEEK